MSIIEVFPLTQNSIMGIKDEYPTLFNTIIKWDSYTEKIPAVILMSVVKLITECPSKVEKMSMLNRRRKPKTKKRIPNSDGTLHLPTF